MAFENTNAVVANAAVDAAFIPELWSDEVVAAYKSNLVFANLVRKLNHRGKKGDTIYIPRPSRSVATRRSSTTTPYTVSVLAYADDTRITVPIDKHTEYTRLFDDFAQVQSLESLRRFFTDDAGYAISQAVDIDLINEQLGVAFSTLAFVSGVEGTIDASASTYVASSALEGDGTDLSGLNATAGGAYAAITDDAIRAGVRRLDDNDVPMANRYWAIAPSTKETLIGLPRFTEEAFVGERGGANSIRNGLIGDTYSVEVYVTNQLPQIDASDGATVLGELSLMFHQDAEVLVEQMGVRTQQQYKQEFLADLMTADMIYGVQNLRDTSIVPIISSTS